MIVYSVILFAAAVLILIVGRAIYRGKTDLIHDYHRQNVPESERLRYGRAFAGGLFVLGGALALSGGIALFGDSGPITAVSLAVLTAGLVVSIVMIVLVQKKYNGGMF